jgi:hypothetical protein
VGPVVAVLVAAVTLLAADLVRALNGPPSAGVLSSEESFGNRKTR